MKQAIATAITSLILISSLSPYAISQRKSRSDTHVRSYKSQKGKTVQSHMRSHRDSTKANNFSTKGNRNPYTGKRGTKRN